MFVFTKTSSFYVNYCCAFMVNLKFANCFIAGTFEELDVSTASNEDESPQKRGPKSKLNDYISDDKFGKYITLLKYSGYRNSLSSYSESKLNYFVFII